MPKSPEELAHLEWLGYVQPVGLVVSIPALLEAQCYVNKNIMGEHARFLGCLAAEANGNTLPEIADFALFTQQVLGWDAADLREVPKLGPLAGEMASLEVILPQYNETLRPTHVVCDLPNKSLDSSTNHQPLATNPYSTALPSISFHLQGLTAETHFSR